MSITPSIVPITSGYNTSKINDNFVNIQSALSDAFSLSGSTPNQLTTDIDLNGNDLLNGGQGSFTRVTLNGTDITTDAFTAGPQGDKGWSPAFAVVSDGARRVLQLVAYVGGAGTVPTTNIGFYVGPTGMTATLASGVDIRGQSGTGTGDMTAAVYDAANITQQVVGTTATQTLTNKTLTSPVINTGTATTPSPGDNDTSIATTAFVQSAVSVQKLNQQLNSYTLILSDQGKLVTIYNTSATTLTIPPNSSVAFPIGTHIDILQINTGQISVVAGSGVSIGSSGSKLKLSGFSSAATLIKGGVDFWFLVGDITT